MLEESVKVTKEAKIESKLDGSETQVNQYLILESLGTGGFSQVYLCRDRYRNQDYAMKVMSKSFLRKQKEFYRIEGRRRPGVKTALDDVEREIALMKKISHPHIVKFYELIDDLSGDSIYMVLEYMTKGQVMYWNVESQVYEGNSKAFIIETTNKALSLSQTEKILKEVVEGLKYLHLNNIVHRDLKPENILIGSSGVAKLTDFGVAQQLTESIDTDKPPHGGTPWFMSPELINPSSVTEANSTTKFLADIWALGVCIHAFIFTTLPFFDIDVNNHFENVLKNDFKLNESQIKLIGEADIKKILVGCLNKNIENRFTLNTISDVIGLVSKQHSTVNVTQADIETAVSVKIDMLTIIRLKLFVRRWKARAKKNQSKNTIQEVPSEAIQQNNTPTTEKPSQEINNIGKKECCCLLF